MFFSDDLIQSSDSQNNALIWLCGLSCKQSIEVREDYTYYEISAMDREFSN
jgi:hypothetical protein